MRILALEPYYGGSHRAFLDGWARHSRHAFRILGLPAHSWKWRMRHGAVTLAREVARLAAAGESWDALFCSDMLSLAELLGLAPEPVRRLPTVAYFHENQLTYPVRREEERDLHFAFTNLTTALAAGQVWFNSDFHRRELLTALPRLLDRMPDHPPHWAPGEIGAKARVLHPGMEAPPRRRRRPPGPAGILWTARWEHDKDPETFFRALEILEARGVPFHLDVLGESFRQVPPVFERAREVLAHRIRRWGYQERREDYRATLAEADLVVSTARHEFFGLGVAEAVAAGAYPLVPRRLAYPEVLAPLVEREGEEIFYEGGAEALAARLAELAHRAETGSLWRSHARAGSEALAPLTWPQHAPRLDAALEETRASDPSTPSAEGLPPASGPSG